jgi:hypothetical protein
MDVADTIPVGRCAANKGRSERGAGVGLVGELIQLDDAGASPFQPSSASAAIS